MSANGGGGVGKDDAKGFSAWFCRKSQSLHRSRVRDGNVGAAVGDTVLMVAIYDHVVDLGGSRRVTAWVPDCFWLGSVEVRTPKLLFGVSVFEL